MGDWWADSLEVVLTERRLLRAEILPESEVEYYRSKPWKWTKERELVTNLETIMVTLEIPLTVGWSLPLKEMARRTLEKRLQVKLQPVPYVPTMSRPFPPRDPDDVAEMRRYYGKG